MTSKNKFSHFYLSNGIEVVVYPIKEVRAVSVQFGLPIGSSNEDEDKAGTLHFLEHLLMQGSKKFPTPKEAALYFEEIGTYHNASVGALDSRFWFFAPYTKLSECLGAALDMFANPLFLQKSIQNSKQVILAEQKDFWDQPENRFRMGFWQKRFGGDHPYNRIGFGKEEVVANITREKLVSVFDRYYLPANFKLSIAGNFDQVLIKEKLESTLGSWKKEGKIEKQIEPRIDNYKPLFYLFDQPKRQIDFLASFPLKGFKDIETSEFVAYGIISFLLGGSLTSLLNQRIREDLGLVYAVGSDKSFWPFLGSFDVYATIGVENLGKAFEEMCKVLEGVKKNGFEEKDFKRAVLYMNMRTTVMFSEPSEIASYFLNLMVDDLGMITPDDYIKAANSLKLDDINKLTNKMLDFSKAALALTGDEKLIRGTSIRKYFEKITA